MPSIFLGRSVGGGGGGSSAFLGIAYGPVSLLGPPASGGASCWLGFCWLVDDELPDGPDCCGAARSWFGDTNIATVENARNNAQNCARRVIFCMQTIENIEVCAATAMLV